MADASSIRKVASLPSATGRNQTSTRFVDGELVISNGTNWLYPGRTEVTFVGGTADAAFYVANRPMQIVAIREVHSTAGSDAGAVTLAVFKETTTGAPASGVTAQSGTFNMKGTANTVQAATLSATVANTKLAAGDRLSANFTGTTTALAGVVVTVTLKPI